MKIFFSVIIIGCLSFYATAQDPASLMEEGRKLEQRMKDAEALEKYKQAIVIQPTNLKAQIKCAELTCAIGSREPTPAGKGLRYLEAKSYARRALAIDSNNHEANYIMSVVYGKITEVEEKKDVLVDAVKNVKVYADRSVASNPSYGKAYHVLGKWHLEVVTLSAIKKAAIKLLYGGLPPGSIDSAITYMEKCKTLEPYFCPNFYDLGKSYQYNKQYEKAIAALEQLKKLPTRRQSDAEIKEAGLVLLQELQ